MRAGEELLVLQGYLALVMESVEVVHEHARGTRSYTGLQRW
jgi:hypothetical protein